MDYTILPRELIYKNRKELDDFGVYEQSTLNHFIFECLFEKYARLDRFEGFILALFNQAYYICTMAWAEKRPELRFGALIDIASLDYSFLKCKNMVIAIVLLQMWARRWDMHGHRMARLYMLLEEELRSGSEEEIFKNFFVRITQEMQATGINKMGTDNDFVPCEVNMLMLNDCSFDWSQFFGNDKDAVWDFVSGLGKNEKEEKLISEFLRNEMRYAFNKEVEFKYFFEDIDYKIHKKYHGAEEEAKANAEFEAEMEKQILEELEADWNKDRVKELENQNAKLTSRVNQLEKIEAENAELRKQIDQQGVEDINLELEKLKAENEHLQVMNEALQKQNDRYESMAAPDVDLNEEEKLQIDERIIFFSSLLGCSLKSEVVVQTKFAELIQKMTGDDKESIRTRIVAMNTEIQKVDDGKVEKFSDGTLEAARNVYDLIDKAVIGMTRAVKPYQCKQAMENINQTFHLGIKM